MAVFATDSQRFSNVVKYEFDPALGYAREVGASALALGTVVGQVTVGGAYVAHAPAASDGSEVVAGVALGDGTVLVRGPAIVVKEGLTLNAATDTDSEKAAVYAALVAKGILVEDQA